jgi:hypothetical protein
VIEKIPKKCYNNLISLIKNMSDTHNQMPSEAPVDRETLLAECRQHLSNSDFSAALARFFDRFKAKDLESIDRRTLHYEANTEIEDISYLLSLIITGYPTLKEEIKIYVKELVNSIAKTQTESDIVFSKIFESTEKIIARQTETPDNIIARQAGKKGGVRDIVGKILRTKPAHGTQPEDEMR